MREYDHLDVSVDSDVFRITFNRPERLNAVNRNVHEELSTVFEDAQESEARVVVVTGAGDAFCAGGDIKAMNEDEQYSYHEPQSIIKGMVNCEKPIIGRVNGDAVGLGATLALFCDIVIASTDARFGDTHVKVGLSAGDGGGIIWPLLIGPNKAKEFLMTGKLISAEEAEELGLINHAVEPDELDAKVTELVDELATGSQVAIQYTKMSINSMLEDAVNSALLKSLALERNTMHHPDHAHAVEAFKNGEQPNFPTGRDPN
ncbi:enoyl-CoA hydratase/isomerase family protein [Halorarius halobius]|uniref:enoyl-CoA hydratase/isomerase family protein n=1 Tax=Halorarius halobius TaxID=2962671 RepID=UPI0020CC76BF|nr:enoyl-CoA hydratase/isomerase family protein [Halorarius halobius]